MRRGLPWFSALLVLALAAACESGGDDDLGPAATIGPAPTTTSTVARPVDVSVIPEDPADIDEAYVQAVVDALFAVDAQATKIFLETKAPDERAIKHLEAIYITEELDQQIDAWFKTLALRSEQVLPGALQHSVRRIIDMAPDCVFFEADRDFSQTTTNDAPIALTYLGLTPKADSDDPEELNPTAWMLFSDSIILEGPDKESPCAGA